MRRQTQVYTKVFLSMPAPEGNSENALRGICRGGHNRRRFLTGALAAGLGASLPFLSVGATRTANTAALAPTRIAPTRIALGSCCKSWQPQEVWDAILQTSPDLFLFLGDAVYADEDVTGQPDAMQALSRAYQRFTSVEEFQVFRERVPILATWDDHDYGLRDGGEDFALKEAARRLFLDFWQAPTSDPRRNQVGGIYAAHEFGPPERLVQVILLDTRFGRSPLKRLPADELARAGASGFGPYLPDSAPAARMLHEAQWTWLEQQLARPARLRLICSSVPFAAGFRGWESWANFPLERLRLIRLIEAARAGGVLFLSGDVHYGDLSCATRGVPYPLWDLTSSGLTHFWPTPGPNANRVHARTVHTRNFGLVHVRWDLGDPLVVLEVRGVNGAIMLQHTLSLSTLALAE